jgi:putative transposase
MARIARAVAVGIPHHITQRGNYRQVIFVRDDDYRLVSGVAEILQRQIFAEDMGVLPDEQSCALDEKHVYAAVRYVENNPVSARVVKKAENYKWSSAKSHVKKMRDQILAMDCYLVKEIKDWAAYL